MSPLDRSGPLRRVLFQVHLWVGVAAALYVLVVSVTGAALVFRIHLQRAVHPELLTARTDGPQADMVTVLERVRDAYPRGRLSGVDAPTTVRPTHLAYVTEAGRFRTVLSDPVTAEVLGELPEHSVVRTLQDLHRLAASYRATGGSIEALLREVVRSDAFWSESSRWALIKSPVHLAAGACRQLGIASPPIAEIDRWLRASGQSLFDTPGNGEGGWPGQEAWVEPPARLTVRYHLAAALAGRLPPLGLERDDTPTGEAAGTFRAPVGTTLGEASAAALLERLDPAPGLDAEALEREVAGLGSPEGRSAFIRRVMMSPQYQLA